MFGYDSAFCNTRGVSHAFYRKRLGIRKLGAGFLVSKTIACPSGRITVSLGNNTRWVQSVNATNLMARPESIKLYSPTNAILFDSGTYQYDGAGNIKTAGTNNYYYDQVSRLVDGAAETGKKQTYQYDTFGNMKRMTTLVNGVTTSDRPIYIAPATNQSEIGDGASDFATQTGKGEPILLRLLITSA